MSSTVSTLEPLMFTWSGPAGIDVTNEEKVPFDDEFFTSTLTLMNVTDSHEGNYSCSVAYSDTPSFTSTSEIASLRPVSKYIQCYVR